MLPTIGLRMWFRALYPASLGMTSISAEQAFDAGVVYVHTDGSVNLSVTDHVGKVHKMLNVPVPADPENHDHGFWVEWMPYQKEQAAKQEAAIQDTELGGQLNMESLRQKAAAWDIVVEALDQVSIAWRDLGHSEATAAAQQIAQYAANEKFLNSAEGHTHI